MYNNDYTDEKLKIFIRSLQMQQTHLQNQLNTSKEYML